MMLQAGPGAPGRDQGPVHAQTSRERRQNNKEKKALCISTVPTDGADVVTGPQNPRPKKNTFLVAGPLLL